MRRRNVCIEAQLECLDLNGVEVTATKGALYDLALAVATGSAGKAEAAAFFREHVESSG